MIRLARGLLGVCLAAGVVAVVVAVVVLAGAAGEHRDAGAGGPGAARTAAATAATVVRARREIARTAGPRRPRGDRDDAQGPAGRERASAGERVFNLTINWRGTGAAAGRDTGSVVIGGIGTLAAVCSPQAQTLTLTPASGAVRTTANVSDFEGSAATNEQPYSEGGTPLLIGSPTQPGDALPPNGMIFATLSVEPLVGAGGAGPAPATLTLSSEYKVNDPDPAGNDCYLAAQVIVGS